MAALVAQGEIGPLSGFRSRSGQPFSARLKLGSEGKVSFVFPESGGENESRQVVNEQPVGSCPVDGGGVFETGTAYACEHSLKEPPGCAFRIGKQILSREISREEVAQLLRERKTALLPGFLSRKTKRRFSAYLELKEGGKIGFAFEKRARSAKEGSRAPAEKGGKRTPDAKKASRKKPDGRTGGKSRKK